MPRVLICDPLAPEGLAILRAAEGVEVDDRPGLKGDELRAALQEADGAIVRSGTTLTEEFLRGQKRLKAIVRAGVGVDNIEVPAATREGIIVMNTPGGNTLSTAEQTFALLLSLFRHVGPAHQKLRAGEWNRKFVGTQLAGKTVGVIGVGRVGMAVAERFRAFECRVLGNDLFLSEDKAREAGIELFRDVNDLYPLVDILTVHTTLTDETRGMVGREQMARMKKGAYIVNCARGGIVDEEALLEALNSDHLGGAALDVFAEEPNTKSPLIHHPKVVCAPHLGASTKEAQLNVALEAAQLLVDYFKTGRVRHSVNAALDPKDLAEARRYLDVAYRLGLLQAQVVEGQIRRAIIEYQGACANKNTRLITSAFAIGLLQNHLDVPLNLVNCQAIAEERGLIIDERRSSEPSDFANLIRTTVETDKGAFTASGTTRGTSYNRLVRLNDFRLDAFLDGTVLLYHHHDRPGLIGFVGTVLGKYSVNIANMQNGRHEPGGEAIGVMSLDNLPPAEALAELAQDPRMISVKVVKLPPMGQMHPSFA